MKTTHILLNLAVLLLLWSSCKPSCPDPGNQVNYVDKTYLPDIIPYSDTSTALFLKNGKDTLLFKSQGLKETFVGGSTLDSDCPKNFSLQQYSLRMVASDTDFFEIKYANNYEDFQIGKFTFSQFNNLSAVNESEFYYKNFRTVYKPITSIVVLNTKYDSINIFPIKEIGTVYFKPIVGIVKITTTKYTYELIK